MAQGSSKAVGCGCGAEQAAELQRRTLWVVLVINAAMFVVELAVGLRAGSTGLIADSLDMLADAGVYGLSLGAVGRNMTQQRRTAVLSGRLQIILAIWVLLDVLRRTVLGREPISALMVGIGALALLANLGVIVAGLLVAWSGSRIPDLMIGSAISLLVLNGGRRILREARASRV
ncbi:MULTISPECIES: cation transporter [unclassified Cyanobium]|uniref:cation transporter n=1 Tax=unclassified Cyanobium TaxID=2627006 RepID=UPI0020CC2E84|nr:MULTISPECIES: cation transporter [unclassified Cyanobium]MCP9861429.1 cation transporter [Cyanobium sp. Cruz-8H5]MCP9868640.1 cation transporter [Cyanobium sp. Cruz-8D1]